MIDDIVGYTVQDAAVTKTFDAYTAIPVAYPLGVITYTAEVSDGSSGWIPLPDSNYSFLTWDSDNR